MRTAVHLPPVAPAPGPPPGGTYHDAREAARRRWAALAAESRRNAWAERRAAMIADEMSTMPR